MRIKTNTQIKWNLNKHFRNISLFALLLTILFFNIYCSLQITAQDEQPNLIINLDKRTFKENEFFSVEITDENGNAVEGVTVGIQSEGELKVTDSDGLAQLVAPEGKEENFKITIVAQKEGYTSGTTTAWVNKEPGFLESLLENPFTPVLIAVFFLILAIIIVNLRQKKLEKVVGNRTKEITEKQTQKKYYIPQKILPSTPDVKIEEKKPNLQANLEQNNNSSQPNPKVEEIRISKNQQDKKIVTVNPEKNEEKKIIPRRKKMKHDYEWFEGTDDVRYEIDRLTGEIDEEKLDKWFEGIEDIRSKIDKKLKKKDENKNE